MARMWDYPPWKRRALGGVMLLVLGAATGAAALLDRFQASRGTVALDEKTEYDGIRLRLPKGWPAVDSIATDRADERDGSATLELVAIAPSKDRVLSVSVRSRDPRRPDTTVLSLGTRLIREGDLFKMTRMKGEPIRIAGHRGELFRTSGVYVDPDTREAVGASKIAAAADLDGRRTIVVKLLVLDRDDASDVDLVRRVAESIEE